MQSAVNKRKVDTIACSFCGVETQWRIGSDEYVFCKKCNDGAARELNLDPNNIDIVSATRIFNVLVRKVQKREAEKGKHV